jgi:hypothetical protein
VGSHCFFSIREVASAAIIAGDMQAMTDVSEMAQKLISACEEAMTTTSCANTEGDAHVAATAAFDEAASSLGELGFVYEVTRDGVAFSRSASDVEEYDPTIKIGAAPFLVLRAKRDSGTRHPGSSDRRC